MPVQVRYIPYWIPGVKFKSASNRGAIHHSFRLPHSWRHTERQVLHPCIRHFTSGAINALHSCLSLWISRFIFQIHTFLSIPLLCSTSCHSASVTLWDRCSVSGTNKDLHSTSPPPTSHCYSHQHHVNTLLSRVERRASLPSSRSTSFHRRLAT